MSVHNTGPVPAIFGGLTPDQAEVFDALWSVQELAPGEVLVRPGDPGTAAWCVIEGELELFVRLPGGGEAPLGRAAIGELLGEVALMTGQPRGAGLRAVGPVRLLRIDRQDFLGLLAVYQPASVRVQGVILRRQAGRILGLQGRLAELGALPATLASHGTTSPWRDAEAAAVLLGRLATFEGFSLADRRALCDLDHLAVVEAERGATIGSAAGEEPRAWVVLHGALGESIGGPARQGRVLLHAPGEVCGAAPVLLKEEPKTVLRARESSVLLGLPAAGLLALLADSSRVSFKLLSLLNRDLARQVGSLNRALARSRRMTRLQ